MKAEIARFKNTCIWSVEGWLAAWRSEATLRQWTLVNVISVGLTFLVTMTPGERALIWALGLLVLAMELMNTAMEEAIDYISREEHPMAKKTKDCGSAAVALAALAGGVAWVVVLWG